MDLNALDQSLSLVHTVVPMRLEIKDSAGRLAEGSGYHAADQSCLFLDLEVAANDAPGMLEVCAIELASGQRYVGDFQVR